MSSSVLSGSVGADDSEDEYAAVLDSGGAADPGAEASRPEWKARAAAWLTPGAIGGAEALPTLARAQVITRETLLAAQARRVCG